MPLAPHVDRYLARVDEVLTALDDEQGREFIDRELTAWQHRYVRFQALVDAGEQIDPDVTAFDYIDTLSELTRRLGEMA